MRVWSMIFTAAFNNLSALDRIRISTDAHISGTCEVHKPFLSTEDPFPDGM